MSGSDQEPIPLTGDKAIVADSGREAPLRSGFKMTLRLGPVGAILIAILGLLGYVPGLQVLGSIRSDYIPMAPSTAASFMILGAVLLRLSRRQRLSLAPIAMIALVILVMLFSLLNVAGNIAGLDLNFEARLTSGAGTIKGIPVSRMSPLTGAVFVLTGLAILLLLFKWQRSRFSRRLGHCASSLGVLTVLGSSTVLLAYLYGSPFMYSGTSVPMAATTAIAFVLLGAAVAAAAGPESFPLLLVSGDSTSARLSRVFFPLTVAVVILQGLLSHLVSASTVIPNALFLAFLAIVMGTITVAVIVRVAHSLGGSLDRAEAALRQNEDKFRGMAEQMEDVLFTTDHNGTVTYISPSAHRMFGWLPGEMIGRRFLEFLPEEEIPKSLQAFQSAVSQGEPIHNLNLMMRRKDNSIFHGDLMGSPIQDPQGIKGTLGLIRDITERKRIERELKESQTLTEAVVENVPLMIFIKEATDLRFVMFNRAGEELLGYDRTALLGKNNLDLFPPKQAAHFMAKDREVLDGEAAMLDIPEEPILTARKGTRLLHTRKVCIRGADGATKYLLGISEDITERKRAEEEIQRQLAEKEILLKEVHHRIKNNIASIGGLLSLRMQSITNPEAIAVLQDAIGRVNSMRILYDKLLLGKGYEDISVKNYAESLVDGIVALFPDSAKVTVEKDIADFHLDTKRLFPLGLIINELITNKMKYAFINRDSGRIRISLTHINGHATLTIQDDGIGLPDGFDLKKSKGFGLMLVKMLSQQLGGSFSIKKDDGTRSTLEFDI